MNKTCTLAAILMLQPAAALACSMIDGLATYCATREITAPFSGSINVDSSPTGSISVTGWDQPGVLIQAQVTASAPDEAQAVALAAQVSVTESAGVVRASGPAESQNRQWSVNYQISLPRSAGIILKSAVGSISIQGVAGTIRCAANVGSLALDSLSGDVNCQTAVGSVSIVFVGDRWEGSGLVVNTNVGDIDLRIPEHYSAHLYLNTALGSFTSNFPLTVEKNGLARSVSADLGLGGATVSAATGVGAITLTEEPGQVVRPRRPIEPHRTK